MRIEKIASAGGEITVPGDKSISHRAVMLSALADGKSEIYGFLKGEDCLSTLSCFERLGIRSETSGDCLTIYGSGLSGLHEYDGTLYTGNSGTTTRILCGILAGAGFAARINGDESIQRRPMKRVCEPLRLMGAEIKGDFCPLELLPHRLHGIEYNMPVASAQVKTAIMLAGLYAEGETVIHELYPTRDHTERMLSFMGGKVSVCGSTVTVSGKSSLSPQRLVVPGDISSAAYFLVLGAILPNSEITVRNVGINPTRTGIIDVMKQMGADIAIENVREVCGEPVADITAASSALRGAAIGGEMIPRLIDEIPILAVLALFADGETVISDAAELRVKESDRIKAIVTELKRCGADITETEDGMVIRGGRALSGADFLCYNDHRMAMSLAVLAQLLDGSSTIDNEKCADISYPGFFDTLYSLGR